MTHRRQIQPKQFVYDIKLNGGREVQASNYTV